MQKVVYFFVSTQLPELDGSEPQSVNPLADLEREGKYLDDSGNIKKLEQLDNPLVWYDKKTNKKSCIFCSEDRYALSHIDKSRIPFNPKDICIHLSL